MKITVVAETIKKMISMPKNKESRDARSGQEEPGARRTFGFSLGGFEFVFEVFGSLGEVVGLNSDCIFLNYRSKSRPQNRIFNTVPGNPGKN